MPSPGNYRMNGTKPLVHPASHQSSLGTIDEDDILTPPDPPNISQLYCDAAEFEKVLARSGCIESRFSDADGANGFNDLVGRDLSPCEQATAGRVSKLSATGYSLTGDSESGSDPESLDTLSVSDKTSEDSFEDNTSRRRGPAIHRASTMGDAGSWELEPTEIIDLLVKELGALAPEGEEEKLILEADGCLLHDVIILGVIHLTTHRLTFHASLLSTRPDLPPSQRIIKAGPAVIHRKGWRAKRRMWVELSHDMICSYTSNKNRTRPLCTILLATIKSIVPLDPKHPRNTRLVFHESAHRTSNIVEFDTEESAADWRKELTGALFMYRHGRTATLNGSENDADSGVRLSCPLERIMDTHTGPLGSFPSVVSFRVDISKPSTGGDDDDDPEDSHVFQIGPILNIPEWSRLDEFIAAAKQRQKIEPTEILNPVLVDFGPLSFHEAESKSVADGPDVVDPQEKAVRASLALEAEPDVWITRARIYKTIASFGYFVVSQHYISFWSKNLTVCDTKYRLSISEIQGAKPFQLALCPLSGMTLQIEGIPDIRFAFSTSALRDEAIRHIELALADAQAPLPESPTSYDFSPPSSTTGTLVSTGSPSGNFDPITRKQSATGIIAPLSRSLAAAASISLPSSIQATLPKVINLPRQHLVSMAPMHFVCLTIGSRGDVQPYIALGLGLMREGHRVTIVTHREYREWIEGFGIAHREAGGDPGALMKLSVEHKMFSPEFFKESLTNFRPWLDQLLMDAWEACKDADVLLESPSAMAGVHIAEALGIPYFRTFTMPWTKTSEFPHPFLSPPVEAPSFNSASYVLFSNVLWTATSRQINRWRRHWLKIKNTDMGHLAQSKITFIYNFSEAVVPKPLDWGDATTISGYWFLDNPDLNWTPPEDLLNWMAKAREDGKPIVYIGFGSITVPRPNRVTARIIKAVLESDVRAIVSKGWSSRMSVPNDKDPEVEFPPECYALEKIPHDWLFPRIDAALHHGGAGTTGATLRAGIPTLIKPWFGDQFFWASRVQRLGAGLRVPSLRVADLADALTKATTNQAMRRKAALVGEKIRAEDGVHTAIHTIYTYLPRASKNRTLLEGR